MLLLFTYLLNGKPNTILRKVFMFEKMIQSVQDVIKVFGLCKKNVKKIKNL